MMDYLSEHRKRKNKLGYSKWYGRVGKRWRVILLQEYCGRLFLRGALYDGFCEVLPFEAPLRKILAEVGELEGR